MNERQSDQLINFENRHIGLSASDLDEMVSELKISSADQLVHDVIPLSILCDRMSLKLDPLTEFQYLELIRKKSTKNTVLRSLIGQGYYDTFTPSVIRRNIFENPGWYTQYTPYQSEISQGRLEALFNYQTVVSDLTGLPIANASLLDEGTAAGEAISMVADFVNKKNKKNPKLVCYVHEQVFAQTKAVIESRLSSQGYTVEYFETLSDIDATRAVVVAMQYPDSKGDVSHIGTSIDDLIQENIGLVAICDLLSLTLLQSPGALGYDAAVGSTQRFGVPMGYGGPHAAYFSCKEKFKRNIPGRIIGLSKDINGHPAYRMALQTREQHIKREKATSNICTAQALLAILAGMYAVYHGPQNLKRIALKIHLLTAGLARSLKKSGYSVEDLCYFDTLSIKIPDSEKHRIQERAVQAGYNFLYTSDGIQISLDEKSTSQEVKEILEIFQANGDDLEFSGGIKEEYLRKDDFMTHPVFHSYRSETQMMRYIKRLENKDLSLVHSMIPLGSCTMKLNAATELLPLTWTEFSGLHPLVPKDQARGYQEIIHELGEYLCALTDLSAYTFQPNSGAQGEYTGLLLIKAYHEDRGDDKRQIVLIPSSAHGTNPASAILAGYRVRIVQSDDQGNIDLSHLNSLLEELGDQVAALMVTYPSTHGIFERQILTICASIHGVGGLVYMDGANMNAQIGYTSPGTIGADVCHLNLHKTFAIPHGGGGPGMGPVFVNELLAPYLPSHPFVEDSHKAKSIQPVASAPYSSANILLVSYAYIRLLGSRGLKNVTKYAILNANYLKKVLSPHYEVLYSGAGGWVGHELILDLRMFKEVGIQAEDVAKRLIDYGFHAPTLSFPVPGTLMIEPTESEDKKELDRFCEAMIQIKQEIDEIARGEYPADNNVLINAPHPLYLATDDNWDFPYNRSKALYPVDSLREQSKFYSPVARVDNAYGDRNLICTCPPVDTYETT
ncbi:aminomethyl-transferring glycine dehydrogenase [Membranicola marinus]|uniref:glycine dehydrogenase (aminomethyl-transferring) n=1 Tax=Membranihabitans marinus TaxID=1227546 RepID=A0A953HSR1_9BACT|nr:aminomethyl-transferring glycine dehydrogenase [Membranihabitans marinus]MBY5957710.1 aminomethyl-transferring glycine dehydrogenase [Membranihabitans marinus]